VRFGSANVGSTIEPRAGRRFDLAILGRHLDRGVAESGTDTVQAGALARCLAGEIARRGPAVCRHQIDRFRRPASLIPAGRQRRRAAPFACRPECLLRSSACRGDLCAQVDLQWRQRRWAEDRAWSQRCCDVELEGERAPLARQIVIALDGKMTPRPSRMTVLSRRYPTSVRGLDSRRSRTRGRRTGRGASVPLQVSGSPSGEDASVCTR